MRSNGEDAESEDSKHDEGLELVLNDDGLFAASNETAVRVHVNPSIWDTL